MPCPHSSRNRTGPKKAFAKGLPTPAPLGIALVDGFYGSLYELVDGTTYNICFRDHPEAEETLLEEYAGIIRQLHAIETEQGKLEDSRKTYLRYLEELDGILPHQLCAHLRSLILAMPENLHMVHGDLQMQNVMRTTEGPMLIDLDTLGVGDPVFDFAPLQTTYEAFSEDNPHNGMNFAGVPNERYIPIWRKALSYYLKFPTQDVLERAMSKVRVVGYLHFLYLVAILRIEEGPLTQIRISRAISHLQELVSVLDCLTLL